MKKRHGKSDTPDADLGLYQLHSRYAILGGLNMVAAGKLWREMKGLYPDRKSHMAALFARLPGNIIDRLVKEGKEYIDEVKRRTRNPALANCRLQLDKFVCQHCGFSAERKIVVNGEKLKLAGVVVEVHHIDPVNDGERNTKLDDLVTLCPTCHRLLHVLGRTIGSQNINLELMRKYYPSSYKQFEGLDDKRKQC